MQYPGFVRVRQGITAMVHSMRASVSNERGMVLVLAVFMLVLLTMIGLASMMTSTTEIEIAASEKFHKLAFYETETGHTIANEIIALLDGYDTVADNTFMDDNETIKVLNGTFLFEEKDLDNATGIWTKNSQRDGIWVRERGGPAHASFGALSPDSSPDLQVGDTLFVDVDKVAVQHLYGGGAEFGAGSQGVGVATHRVIYHIDSIGTLPGGNNPANHLQGFMFIPR